jgi:Zn-dependent protease
VVTNCPRCGQSLALGTLACQACQNLIYSSDLELLSREARDLEAKGQLPQAREVWNRSLAMLPADSSQAQWVREKMSALEAAHGAVPAPAAQKSGWARKFGPLAPVLLFLAKSKGILLALFKLKFLFSFFAFIALYVALWGWRFGVGFAVCILIHELGHYIDVKRRGLPAEMPVFLPGLGAYVKWQALGVTLRQRAQISLAGPLAGWLAAAGCFLMYTYTGELFWAALARTGAVLNVLNLIPVWILDGGKAANALGMVERSALLAGALAIWYLSGEPIFFLMAAGTAFRLFTRDKPQQDDWSVLIYYVALLAVLGVVLHMTPETMFRRPPH